MQGNLEENNAEVPIMAETSLSNDRYSNTHESSGRDEVSLQYKCLMLTPVMILTRPDERCPDERAVLLFLLFFFKGERAH
jgi:hypothetical protein